MDEKLKAQEVLRKVGDEGRKILTEYESKEILRAYNIPTTTEKLATSAEEAASMASEIGFPVVLKVYSPDITHKTDVGGVKLNLKNASEVERAFGEVMENVKKSRPEAEVRGLLIQNMAPAGREVIVGATKDPQFGPIVMFGLGGVFVEVLKDISFRLPPVSRSEAMDMMGEIKGYPVLKGVRGAQPSDIDSLADVIEKTSRMVLDIPEITELDMNPIFVYEKGLVVVDARILL